MSRYVTVYVCLYVQGVSKMPSVIKFRLGIFRSGSFSRICKACHSQSQKSFQQAEARVVPSSSLAEVKVEVEVRV